MLQLDGVYTDDKGKATPVFVPAPELEDEDVKRIVETTAQRVIRALARRGILDEDQLDPLAEESPLLAGVTAASVQGLIATGERAGMRVRRVLSDPAEGIRTGHLCYASRVFDCGRRMDIHPTRPGRLSKIASEIPAAKRCVRSSAATTTSCSPSATPTSRGTVQDLKD